ncbi:MAG: hypothetical protein LBI99_06160 [Propionibacteriaceae bacterium]|jgi:hypothetical protein|nr:hypothetical protein [Propionibacteriaceae bacterium]
MRLQDVCELMYEWDSRGRYVFTKSDLRTLFDERDPALFKTLERVVAAGVLTRAASGVYVNRRSAHLGGYTVELVAQALRRREFNYVSYESALSEYGAISQIPIGRLTLATTGRSGVFPTPFGTIEFTHTGRDIGQILDGIVERPPHPVPIAKQWLAEQNLRDSNRNVFMLQEVS